MLTSFILTLTLDAQAASPEIVLAEGGTTSFAVAVAAQATASEKHAAAELAAFLGRMAGAEFPVRQVEEQAVPAGNLILVGPDLAAAGGIAVADENLGLEGYVINAAGTTLAVAGGRPRGTLNGVYDLLHYVFGCRFLAPDCTVVPKRDRLAVGPFRRRYVPPLEYRATDYPNSRDADWAARNHLNGTQANLDEERGGKISYGPFVHTFNGILDPASSFAEHPEYFSEIDGKRVGGQTQLCLTNPDVLKIAASTVRRWIGETPSASIFSVSQNDWHNYCRCASCAAVAREEGAESGPLLRFVNAIAADVADDFPRVAIDTLAYQYTRKPPALVRPRSNVIVRLCSIECCFNHPLESHPFNAAFRRDIEEWGKICRRLHIWDYAINYSHSIQPFPNLRVIAPNIRFFLRNGVKGIYEEANYFTRGGEFAELRTYLIARTLWDPAYDTDQAIDEFLAGYYGAAAEPIRAYIDLLYERARNPAWHCTIWIPPTFPLYGDDFIPRAVALFNEAERRVAQDPEKLARVRTATLPITYLRLARAADPGFREKDPAFDRSVDYGALLDGFLDGARKAGITQVCESGAGALAPWEAALRPLLPKPKPFQVLLVTGHDYPGHRWQETAPALKRALEASGRLAVRIVEDPDFLGTGDLAPYDVVLLHFADWEPWKPAETARAGLEKFVRGGKGMVAIHFACGAFLDWPEFVQIIGRVYDRKRTHDPYREFTVSPVDRTHPLTAGLEDFTIADELYFCLIGETPIQVLARAHSEVTKQDELMAHVLTYGSGRVFFSPLGHDLRSFSSAGLIKLLTRACVWTARGIPE